MKKNLVLFFILLGLIIVFLMGLGGCSSRSGKRAENAITDISIYKSDIIQDDGSVYFTTYDTAHYIVTSMEYRASIYSVKDMDDFVFIDKAYPTSDNPTVTYLKIE